MAAAILAVSVVVYGAIRNHVRGQIDQGLQERAGEVAQQGGRHLRAALRSPHSDLPPLPRPRLGGPAGLTQFVLENGRVLVPGDQDVVIPSTPEAREVAAGDRSAFFSDTVVEGSHMRVLTRPLAPGIALQVARPLEEADQFLRRLLFILGAAIVGGTALATALARLVASTALSPVAELTAAAEKVAGTKDLAHRIAREGSDELGRLASSFNDMLEALDASLKSQRQLVADASHELRTPLTSLRTNLEVLARSADLPGSERERLLGDVLGQLDELTLLMNDLIDLARGDEPGLESEEVRLDLVAEAALERARRHWPDLVFSADLSPTTVRGVPSRLERAITNLLDNAAKWSPRDSSIDLLVSDGSVRVRDRGPGIAEEDLPHIFDRFYRAASARGMAGSGLGLAIVRQVASSHGGLVSAENADGTGAVLTLTLPTTW